MNLWKPATGAPVEVRLEYPIPAGSVKHFCWFEGTVKTAAVMENGRFAGGVVELGNGTTTVDCSVVEVRPAAPWDTYIDAACWHQVLHMGDPVDVMFKGAWCPATVVALSTSPKLLLHGHLHLLTQAEVTRLRCSKHWCRTADGMWGWRDSEVPSHIRQLLTRKGMPRARWLNVRLLTAGNASSCAASHSLPPLPTELPSHVPRDMAAVPVFRAEHIICNTTGSWATSFIPAVLARLSDVASSSAPGKGGFNFTPEQWQAVVRHLGLSDKLVADIDRLDGFTLCGRKRTREQADVEPLGIQETGEQKRLKDEQEARVRQQELEARKADIFAQMSNNAGSAAASDDAVHADVEKLLQGARGTAAAAAGAPAAAAVAAVWGDGGGDAMQVDGEGSEGGEQQEDEEGGPADGGGFD